MNKNKHGSKSSVFTCFYHWFISGKKVKKSGLSENFCFTGKVPRKTVLEYLEQADIFAIPSSDEVFGISIIEESQRKTRQEMISKCFETSLKYKKRS